MSSVRLVNRRQGGKRTSSASCAVLGYAQNLWGCRGIFCELLPFLYFWRTFTKLKQARRKRRSRSHGVSRLHSKNVLTYGHLEISRIAGRGIDLRKQTTYTWLLEDVSFKHSTLHFLLNPQYLTLGCCVGLSESKEIRSLRSPSLHQYFAVCAIVTLQSLGRDWSLEVNTETACVDWKSFNRNDIQSFCPILHNLTLEWVPWVSGPSFAGQFAVETGHRDAERLQSAQWVAEVHREALVRYPSELHHNVVGWNDRHYCSLSRLTWSRTPSFQPIYNAYNGQYHIDSTCARTLAGRVLCRCIMSNHNGHSL